MGVLASLAGWPLSAQGPVDAALRGRVIAVDGSAAVGVEVRVRCPGQGTDRSTRSARDGTFLLLRLPPGDCVVEAEQMAASAQASAPISLQEGEIADLTLTLGQALHQRTGAQPPGPATTLAEMEQLPLESRGWEGLAASDAQANDAALVSPENQSDADEDDAPVGRSHADGAAATGISLEGLPATQNATLIDGLSAGQSFRSGPRGAASSGPSTGSSFAQGGVRSFRVLPRTFSAQYGNAAGGVMAVVSRSSPPRLHGSAFVLSRQSAWAATNPFSIVTHYNNGAVTGELAKPSGSMEQIGAAAGGPLGRVRRGRPRAAIFGSAEAQLRNDKIISTPALASFYELTATQTALLAARGVGAAATRVALNYLDSLTGTVARSAYRVQSLGRADLAVSPKNEATLGYIGNRFDSPSGAALGQASDAVVARGTGSLGESTVHIDAGTGRWLHTFSPRFNQELRGQLAHDLEYETAHAPLPQEPAIGPGGSAPQVTIAPNGFAYGTPANLGRSAYPEEWRLQLADTLQLRLGKHLLMLGGDWSRVNDRVAAVTNADGSFSYDSGVTGGHAGGLVDWISDFTFNVNAYPNGACPSIVAAVHSFCFRTFTQSFGPMQTQFTLHELAGFAEDSFRPRDGLMVTLGVRYEYTLLPLPQTPNLALDATVGGITAGGGGATASFPEDRNNVEPRLALEWSPGSRRGAHPWFTAHVGYGVFFGRLPGATVRAALTDTALPATTTRIRITPKTITNCPQIASGQGFGYPCDYTSAPPAAVAQTTSAMVFAPKFRLPAVQRATLSVEREMTRHLWLRAGYSMAVATQLPTSVDINIAPSSGLQTFVLQGGAGSAGLRPGETFVVPVYATRLTTLYGAISEVVSNANATYHAGTLETRWTSRGLELRGGYTFSRAIDYAPQQSATPGLNGQFDPFRDGYDKGLSSLQFAQHFSGQAIYAPRREAGGQRLRSLLNGWRLAAIASAGSGAPYSYNIFGGTYLSGGRESINGSGGATYLPTVGRNTLRLPPRSRVDLRVGRDFNLHERTRLNVFAQAFNLLNAENLSRVETRAFLVGTPAVAGAATPLIFQDAPTIASEGLATPAFGTALSSTTGLGRERQVEMGVRLEF